MDDSLGSFVDASPIPEASQSTLKPGSFDETLRPATADGAWLSNEAFSRSFSAASVMSSTDPGRTRRRSQARSKMSSDGRAQSAPLLPASQSTHASTWYSTTTAGSGTTRAPSMWKPLGAKWRDWESDEFGPVRRNVDEGDAFRDGCVPHWGKGCSMRKLNVLEHELTWAYYRMRRHNAHPHRTEVGDPTLPPECVVEAMRHGKGNQFQFWRDIRPPFNVSAVHRLHEEASAGTHPDGDLFEVVFECGIDYVGERLWGLKADGGTFNNRIHSSARVRIPDGFPRKRPIVIVSWGSPQLNWQPGDETDDDGNPLRPVHIDPAKWMPISDELKQRADRPRFARCREATKRADSRRGIEVAPMQKLLLGPHASLQKMAACDPDLANMSSAAREAAVARLVEEGFPVPPKKVKPRQHRIFTAAGGFVRYAG